MAFVLLAAGVSGDAVFITPCLGQSSQPTIKVNISHWPIFNNNNNNNSNTATNNNNNNNNNNN